ncbi:MAG TPA: hypothetical protein VKQ36_12930 [Ktedonobacterales bacterium]|nr:hypothetical protein [Ktedonobacterales bacterium]
MKPLRVMTFNIANAINTEDDGVNAWALRADLNIATIKRYAPDLIGFQQVDQGNLETGQPENPICSLEKNEIRRNGRGSRGWPTNANTCCL